MTEESKEEELRLEVKASRISMGIAVRISNGALEKLGIEEGEKVDVKTDEEHRTLVVYADNLMGEKEISIPLKEIERLGIEEGGSVIVSPHRPLTERLKEGIEDSTGKLKERFDRLVGHTDEDESPGPPEETEKDRETGEETSGGEAKQGKKIKDTVIEKIEKFKGLFKRKPRKDKGSDGE